MATYGTRLLSLLSRPVQAQIAGIEQHQRAAQYRQMARFYREEKGAESLRKSSELSEAEKAEGVLLLALPPTQTGGHKRELSLSRQEVTSSTISPLAEGKPFPDIFDADFVEFSLEVAPLEATDPIGRGFGLEWAEFVFTCTEPVEGVEFYVGAEPHPDRDHHTQHLVLGTRQELRISLTRGVHYVTIEDTAFGTLKNLGIEFQVVFQAIQPSISYDPFLLTADVKGTLKRGTPLRFYRLETAGSEWEVTLTGPPELCLYADSSHSHAIKGVAKVQASEESMRSKVLLLPGTAASIALTVYDPAFRTRTEEPLFTLRAVQQGGKKVALDLSTSDVNVAFFTALASPKPSKSPRSPPVKKAWELAAEEEERQEDERRDKERQEREAAQQARADPDILLPKSVAEMRRKSVGDRNEGRK